MNISRDLQTFIEANIDTIEQNTKESWKLIYTNLNNISVIRELTELMLSIGVDPSEKLGYIPDGYLWHSKIKEYTIPDNITSIGDYAFSYCPSLTEIVIPENVTSIGGWAFQDCRSLTKIVIPASVTSIDLGAFQDSMNLTEIKFKGTVKEAIKSGIGNKSKTKWRNFSSIRRIICTDGEIIL